MVTTLKSTDSEKLDKEELSRRNAWISLGRGSRIHFVGGLGADGGRELEALDRGGRDGGRDAISGYI